MLGWLASGACLAVTASEDFSTFAATIAFSHDSFPSINF